VATRKPAKGKAAKGPSAEGPAAGGSAAGGAGGPIPLEEFRRIPAFAGLGEEDARLFLSIMRERPAARGEPILRHGEVGDGLFVVLAGRVSILKRNAKGGEREVAVLERNEVFGEMDLISDRPHTAGAKAAESARLLFLPKKEFQKLLVAGNPGATSMVIYFARMLAGRLDDRNRQMMEMLDQGRKPAGGSEFAEFKRRLLREWTF
jgi:CRP-like cAMP-binding protein